MCYFVLSIKRGWVFGKHEIPNALVKYTWVRQMKILIFFISQFIEHIRYTIAPFF